jgi:hypothetical protein
LLAEDKLSAGDFKIDGERVVIKPERWEKVATAICEHFLNSGEFSYTLQLTRRDLTLDPNEDFLRNLRRGHCERYASALALAVRSCGIPSRVVIGFRGLEPTEREGSYVVRQNAAHSWVEVAVPRTGTSGKVRWHWFALDATPSENQQAADTVIGYQGWTDWQQLANLLWRNFVVEYNADVRSETGNQLLVWLMQQARQLVHGKNALTNLLGAAAFLIVLLVCLRLWRRRRSADGEKDVAPAGAATFGFAAYAQLLALLKEKLALVPRRSQTPLEFAQQAGVALRTHGTLASWSDLPGRIADVLYRTRFGRQEIAPEEIAELDRSLREIHEAASAQKTPAVDVQDRPGHEA